MLLRSLTYGTIMAALCVILQLPTWKVAIVIIADAILSPIIDMAMPRTRKEK